MEWSWLISSPTPTHGGSLCRQPPYVGLHIVGLHIKVTHSQPSVWRSNPNITTYVSSFLLLCLYARLVLYLSVFLVWRRPAWGGVFMGVGLRAEFFSFWD